MDLSLRVGPWPCSWVHQCTTSSQRPSEVSVATMSRAITQQEAWRLGERRTSVLVPVRIGWTQDCDPKHGLRSHHSQPAPPSCQRLCDVSSVLMVITASYDERLKSLFSMFPFCLSGKESCLPSRRFGFNPWVGKIL